MPNLSLRHRLPVTALAFRGYNVTNLGRTGELLANRVFGPSVERQLRTVSAAASDLLHRHVDLVAQIRSQQETTLESYGEALALVLGVESIQLSLLRECFDVDPAQARFSFGFSLGEVGAVIHGGILDLAAALQALLPLADDCVALTQEATLGVLFTRSRELALDDVRRLCLEVNQEGRGVVGISAQLAPNTLLVIGQNATLDRLMARARETLNTRVHLRKNDYRWPPVHTPIVWQRQIPNRAAERMHTLPVILAAPRPRVFSLVTGTYGYTPVNARDLMVQWVDHTQRLWDGVYETLASGVTTVLHIGPAPNIIPATYKRLSADVISQTQESRSLRALSAAVRRQWLRRLLPQRTALLRAPYIEQIILEDWLLEQAPR
jgi:[acyl-carrier-protein] S-malonyltransferase